jgi:two-component system, LytTR family, response regulator
MWHLKESPVRIAIVDDEELARRIVREYLAGVDDVEIVAECANGFEAVKAVTELKPDVLLLDVQMPKLTGFEVVELIGREQAVVFVTAYDQYALRAFEVHAVDYLLKPFERERLLEALARARARLASREPSRAADVAAAAVREARPRPIERVLVRDGSKVHVVPVGRIEYVQAQDDYVCIRTEGRELLKEQTLGDLEASLDPARFVRIHRSYLLNIDRLARVEPASKDSRVAILKDGTELPVSRTGYQRLEQLLR